MEKLPLGSMSRTARRGSGVVVAPLRDPRRIANSHGHPRADFRGDAIPRVTLCTFEPETARYRRTHLGPRDVATTGSCYNCNSPPVALVQGGASQTVSAPEEAYHCYSIVHVIVIVCGEGEPHHSPLWCESFEKVFLFCFVFGWRRAPKPVALARRPVDVEDGDGPAMGTGQVRSIR